ncbi:acyltransferase [Exidia glandulosa HHB12029]|uniref:Acyltransferase n=1 Tax=Exidia glandulosa HHB12029 TaxID=1314781 RepID=A0A165F0A3_EXIGL|nr:acyltransferase [Exidia glandulosa HHB12029]
MDAPWIHRLLCITGGKMVDAFYSAIHVDGEENIPPHGVPLIVVSSHHNQIVDICVMSRDFPHKRRHSYWAKRSLFKHPVSRYILLNSGNIPVDRKNNDNQTLLRGSFEILKSGEALTLFPEGTSYTEPRILQVKDGASWAALEYSKWRKTHGGKPAVVVPVGMVYTDKSQYRSAVVKRYGPPIDITSLEKQFESGEEKEAVKDLTRLIEQRIVGLTINAVDWDTYHVAIIARQILWTDDARVPLEHFVHISQTLADLFATKDIPAVREAKKDLVAYFALLEHVGTSHTVLSSVFPFAHQPSGTRAFLFAAFSTLLHLPLFALPLVLNIPTYFAAMRGSKLAGDEVEARAQNKIIFGLLARLAVHSACAVLLAKAPWQLGVGWMRAFVVTAIATWLHSRLIDGNYMRWRRLTVAFHAFRAAWAPRSTVPADKLAPYLVPYTPPPNPYVKLTRALPPAPQRPRPPPRHTLMQHLFRARARATHALGELFGELERGSIKVAASPHMARAYGNAQQDANVKTAETAEVELATASRDAAEVVAFLKAHGAVFPPPATR